MKRMIVLAAIFIPGLAFAQGIQSGTVAEIRVSTRTIPGGNPTHVRLQAAATSSPIADCAATTKALGFWAIDTDTSAGKNLLSALLMAEATGKQVVVWGTGACDLRSDMETVYQVIISP